VFVYHSLSHFYEWVSYVEGAIGQWQVFIIILHINNFFCNY